LDREKTGVNMGDYRSIDDVLGGIETLRNSLRFSDEILPLISDLFVFLKDIIPLMLEANSSLRESTNKIPTASENLNKISEATEMAANEVMDRLETINAQLDELRLGVVGHARQDDLQKSIDNIQNSASEIILAFQFQDITTQQLEHVHRILEAIHLKFMTLIKSFTTLRSTSQLGKDVFGAIDSALHEKLDEESRKYFEERTQDIMRHNAISQDDIDQFFKK